MFMFPSKEERIKKWAITRARGMHRFILVKGVLAWGVTTALLWSLIMCLITPNYNIKFNLPLALVLFPLGGIGWGYWVWCISERKFLKHTNASNS